MTQHSAPSWAYSDRHEADAVGRHDIDKELQCLNIAATDANPRPVSRCSLVLGACLMLAACGSSSGGGGEHQHQHQHERLRDDPRQVGQGATGPLGPAHARFTALRECLQKNGHHASPAHTRAASARLRAARRISRRRRWSGRSKLPKGVTRRADEAALKKCGGGGDFAGGASRPFRAARASSKALAKFAACMRENGVNMPAPNTSGKGPMFDTKGIDTSSATVQGAETKCRSDLRRLPARRRAERPAAPPLADARLQPDSSGDSRLSGRGSPRSSA